MTEDKKNEMAARIMDIAKRTADKRGISLEEAMGRVVKAIMSEYPEAAAAFIR